MDSEKIFECLVCMKKIQRGKYDQHLLFGYVECTSCHWGIDSCNEVHNRCQHNGSCNHDLEWRKPQHSRLTISSENQSSEMLNYFKGYLRETETFLNIPFWTSGYKLLYSYMKSLENQLNKLEDCETCSTKNKSIIHASKCQLNQSCLKFPNLQQKITEHCGNTVEIAGGDSSADSAYGDEIDSDDQDVTKMKTDQPMNMVTLNMPENDNYLISSELFDNCPECFTELDSNNLVFNAKNGLITIKCQKCTLILYFVVSLEGMKPMITIQN